MLSIIKRLISVMALLIAFAIIAGPVSAVEPVIYTAPDGLKIISYAKAWQDTKKLREVYLELHNNIHGPEIELLSRIYIYPGPAPDNPDVSGHWSGGTRRYPNGKIVMEANSFINIYQGEKYASIEEIARTLSHEYGHLFTFYYYFKYENKPWEKWRESGYAKARRISDNSKVTAKDTEHYWHIQEIAAEDYVQLFGSPTAKQSVVYRDIQDRLVMNERKIMFSTNTYNIQPQENWHLLPAANLPQVRAYWLKAAGLKSNGNQPPTAGVLNFPDIKEMASGHRQYLFSWTPGQDDNSGKLEYTLVRFQENYGRISSIEPVRTVYDGNELIARYGAAANSEIYSWQPVPPGVNYFVVLVKDTEGFITSSNIIAVDFTNKDYPEAVSIDDKSRLAGSFLQPRVKAAGVQLDFDVPPVIQNNRLLVPLRMIFEKLGAQVEWDGVTRTITATKADTVLQLRVGDKFAQVNGRWIEIDVPAKIISGRTLIPLRFISEALGANVQWNQNLQLATITLQE